MRAGFAFLFAGYVLSQFYRAFLAVLAPALAGDAGAAAGDLARANGLWFLAFAAMQIPVGAGLDRYGPRRVAGLLLALFGAGGAVVFATATTPLAIDLAMILIGIGCSPVLMALYFLFARQFAPALFGTLAGLAVGVGSLGNIAGTVPLAAAAEAFGWRGTLLVLAAATLIVSFGILAFVRDPDRAVAAGGGSGSLLDVLQIPALWLILPLALTSLAPSSALRGLWIGPYLRDVFALDPAQTGRAALFMGLAMVAGNFAYGPLDRVFGSRKWVVVCGSGLALACLTALALRPAPGVWLSVLLLSGTGLFGASFPMLMAHGRSFVPAHLTGRGVTLLNMCAIGGVGLMQVASGPLQRAALARLGDPADAYGWLFGFFAVALAAGLGVYLWSQDRTG